MDDLKPPLFSKTVSRREIREEAVGEFKDNGSKRHVHDSGYFISIPKRDNLAV